MTQFLKDVATEFPDYLRDESRRTGTARSISFPESEQDIRDDLADASRQGLPVTVQGARTGVTGGAVPDGGHILNLSKLNRILELRPGPPPSVVVEPGVSLADLNETIRKETGGRLFLPPDPTEASASTGGMVACNASGARSFRYGATRRYVNALDLILADSSRVSVTRGIDKSQARSFSLQSDSGRLLEEELPSYAIPEVKNAAGYFARSDMDLVDLFVGSEGTLGIASRIELLLIQTPAVGIALLAFLPDEGAAIDFVRRVRVHGASAIEFFGDSCLELVRHRQNPEAPLSENLGQLGEVPANVHSAIYVESLAHSERESHDFLERTASDLVECHGDPELVWIATDDFHKERLKRFRHAVPESVNMMIAERKKRHPGLTKLGTDLAVPDQALPEMMAAYREGLRRSGLRHVIFGHIGDNHVHVNIIPDNPHDYEKGRALYREWAGLAVRLGGTVSAEHGIGKLKRDFLAVMYGAAGIEEMRRVKRCFDPEGLLNRGNLFEWETTS